MLDEEVPAPFRSRADAHPLRRRPPDLDGHRGGHCSSMSPYSAYEAARRGELPVRVIGRRMLIRVRPAAPARAGPFIGFGIGLTGMRGDMNRDGAT